MAGQESDLGHLPAQKHEKDGDDDGEVGSVNSGQIKQMEFVYTVISAS